jgi:hypothetical protein
MDPKATKRTDDDVNLTQSHIPATLLEARPQRMVLLIAFWNAHCILFKTLNYGGTVNAYCYCTKLWHQKKNPGFLTQKVIFLYDNAQPYTTHVTMQLPEQFH